MRLDPHHTRERWKDLAGATAALAWTWPQVLRVDGRLPYLAQLAHAAGEATELVVMSRQPRT